MLFKIYYQENKEITPRRENTRSMYIDIPAETELEGVIKLRELISEKTSYRIELIDRLSENAEKYERETTDFKVTKL